MEEQLRRDALEYHRVPTFGKISVTPTKSLVNQRDLALAYSPGVAYACLAIKSDPGEAATLTSRANLRSRAKCKVMPHSLNVFLTGFFPTRS
jgi:malate dehydrogenase (oxaloacetate-decarboxylating)(NADP+)